MRLIALLMLIPFLAYGEVKSKIGADTVTVGVPSSGNNITFKYQDTTMATRANKATGKLQFTNDSVAWKDFGSGDGAGGSGVNIISNPSYEDAVSIGWTNSGGTFTQETYSNNDGINTKYARFVASGSGQYFRTTALVIPTPLTGACIAYIGKYNTSNNNVFIARVLDSSFNIIASQAIATSNGAWTGGDTSSVLIPFPCPSAGQTRYFDVISTGAGTIDADLMYFGSENRLVRVQPNGLVLAAYFAGATSCTQVTSTTGAWTDFGSASACGGLTIINSYGGVTASTSDTDRNDRITVSNLKAGKYKIVSNYPFGINTSAAMNAIRITDGTVNGPGSATSNGQYDNSTSIAYFDYASDQASVTFKLQCYAISPSTGCSIQNASPGSAIVWEIQRIDSNADLAISQSQSEWMIDVSIGGASPSISAVSSYTEITSASLDLVVNDKSAPAKIPCSGTNPSTGLTCSAGNEGIGIVFNPPYAGLFQVCSTFQSRSTQAVSYSNDAAYQLMLTQNSSQTIIAEGKEKTSNFFQFDGYAASTSHVGVPHRLCGIFNFSDTSEKTIRLMYELSGTNSQIVADRSASVGQRDIHFTVIPLKAGIQPMKMGDTLTSKDASSPDFCSAKVSATGVLSDQVGGCFASCTNATTPVCTFTSGYWKSGSVPNCWHSIHGGASVGARTTTATEFSGVLINSGTPTSGGRDYFCHGQTK